MQQLPGVIRSMCWDAETEVLLAESHTMPNPGALQHSGGFGCHAHVHTKDEYQEIVLIIPVCSHTFTLTWLPPSNLSEDPELR